MLIFVCFTGGCRELESGVCVSLENDCKRVFVMQRNDSALVENILSFMPIDVPHKVKVIGAKSACSFLIKNPYGVYISFERLYVVCVRN